MECVVGLKNVLIKSISNQLIILLSHLFQAIKFTAASRWLTKNIISYYKFIKIR